MPEWLHWGRFITHLQLIEHLNLGFPLNMIFPQLCNHVFALFQWTALSHPERAWAASVVPVTATTRLWVERRRTALWSVPLQWLLRRQWLHTELEALQSSRSQMVTPERQKNPNHLFHPSPNGIIWPMMLCVTRYGTKCGLIVRRVKNFRNVKCNLNTRATQHTPPPRPHILESLPILPTVINEIHAVTKLWIVNILLTLKQPHGRTWSHYVYRIYHSIKLAVTE